MLSPVRKLVAQSNLVSGLRQAFELMPRRNIKPLILLALAMSFGAWIEVATVTLLVPFVQCLGLPDAINRVQYLSKLAKILDIKSNDTLTLYCAFIILAAYLFKALYFRVLYHFEGIFLANIRKGTSQDLFSFYLHNPYSFFLKRNSAELRAIIHKSVVITDTVWAPFCVLVSETLVVFLVAAVLLVVRPLTTLIATLLLGLLVSTFYARVKRKITNWTEQIHHYSVLAEKWILQSFGGIKEIKISEKEDFFLENYSKYFSIYTDYVRRAEELNQIPRLYVETTIVVGVICAVIITLSIGKSSSTQVMSSITIFALMLIRLLPSVSRILHSFMKLRQGTAELEVLLQDVNLHRQSQTLQALNAATVSGRTQNKMKLTNSIRIEDLCFQYSGASKRAVENLNIEIPKGHSVAFVGKSGAGKTTTIDLLLGILTPNSGEILVDGKSIFSAIHGWRKNIGYVPQHIFLIDDSVHRNIAFGIKDNEIDEQKIWEALEIAQLDDFIKGLPEGLNTEIGERGVRLSGGQRQRLGIARALYQEPEVLVLDEATASVDNETERAFIQSLERLQGQKTIIVIAHRLTTVASCNKIFYMKDGRMLAEGNFSDLLKNTDFQKFSMMEAPGATPSV